MEWMAVILWDPDRVLFVLPKIGIPVGWYGILFALGFLVSYHLFLWQFTKILQQHTELTEADFVTSKWDLSAATKRLNAHLGLNLSFATNAEFVAWANANVSRKVLEQVLSPHIITISKRMAKLGDQFLFYLVIAAVVGARLGHMFLYEPWQYIANDPMVIFRVWEGGLASHGGILAVIGAIYLFYYRDLRPQFPRVRFLTLIDVVGIFTLVAGVFIRVGNFFNQEVVGVPSQLPWAVLFAHPASGLEAVPRHPAQLYEALIYLMLSTLLLALWRRYGQSIEPGRFAGMAIFGAFAARFCIEGLKHEQSLLLQEGESVLLMGQYLSIPLMLVGLSFVFFPEMRKWRQRVSARGKG